MASAFIRSVVSQSAIICKYSFTKSSTLHASKGLVKCMPSAERAFSRSYNAMRSSTYKLTEPEKVEKVGLPTSKTCGCRSLHTSSEEQLSKLLVEEIEYEKQKDCEPVTVDGFEVKTEGPNVTLTKKAHGDTVKITLNVTNTHEEDFLHEEDPAESEESREITCRPPFLVEIDKGGRERLAIQCSFEQYNRDGEEGDGEDAFAISEVALLTGEDWGEKTYCVMAENIGGGFIMQDMYDHLMDVLHDRGITDTFAEQLMGLCTAYEHKQYIDFLKSLKVFLK